MYVMVDQNRVLMRDCFYLLFFQYLGLFSVALCFSVAMMFMNVFGLASMKTFTDSNLATHTYSLIAEIIGFGAGALVFAHRKIRKTYNIYSNRQINKFAMFIFTCHLVPGFILSLIVMASELFSWVINIQGQLPSHLFSIIVATLAYVVTYSAFKFSNYLYKR